MSPLIPPEANWLDETECADQVALLREINHKLLRLFAHELGSPLTFILGYLRLWQERALYGERMELDLVVEQALTLKSRLDDLILLDQLEAGLWTLHLQSVSPEQVISRVIQEHRWKLEERGVRLLVSTNGCAPVMADAEMLFRALDHLVSNAGKFSHAGDLVELRVERQGKMCALAVLDQGIGIAPDLEKKILEPFYQVDLTSARRANGLGIGLKLVRAIIEKHGGEIQIKSNRGRGSIFSLTLPFANGAH